MTTSSQTSSHHETFTRFPCQCHARQFGRSGAVGSQCRQQGVQGHCRHHVGRHQYRSGRAQVQTTEPSIHRHHDSTPPRPIVPTGDVDCRLLASPFAISTQPIPPRPLQIRRDGTPRTLNASCVRRGAGRQTGRALLRRIQRRSAPSCVYRNCSRLHLIDSSGRMPCRPAGADDIDPGTSRSRPLTEDFPPPTCRRNWKSHDILYRELLFF